MHAEAEAYAAGVRYRAALEDYRAAIYGENLAATDLRAARANALFIAQTARVSGIWDGYDAAMQAWRDAEDTFRAALVAVEDRIAARSAARAAARAAGFPVD